jgi:hypothetical protein
MFGRQVMCSNFIYTNRKKGPTDEEIYDLD